jgi:hypothetical protein
VLIGGLLNPFVEKKQFNPTAIYDDCSIFWDGFDSGTIEHYDN